MIKSVLFRTTKRYVTKLDYQICCYSMLDKLPTIDLPPEPLNIEDKPIKKDKTSRAMKHYLDKVTMYNKFMADEKHNFEVGKRHLANMMGRDAETFSQDDIDESIEYLFPCGLFEKPARPIMKPPEHVFPPQKEAEFDESGRPFHFLFYTANPNFYQLLHDAVKKMQDLNDFEDKIIRGEEIDPHFSRLGLESSKWIAKDKLEKQLQEKISNSDYEKFVLTFERLANHPYAKKWEEFIVKRREFFEQSVESFHFIEPEVLEDGRKRVTFRNIRKNNTYIDLSLTCPGTGKIWIDGDDIRHFSNIQCRETILFPLVLTKMVNKVDIEVTTKESLGGYQTKSGAMRLGIARGLYYFVDEDMKERLHLAGLLHPEIRVKERKKPGQEGARRKYAWRKR